MAQHDEDKPQRLPDKFRASTDPQEPEAFARLLANDDEQKALGERINSPFTANTPLEAARSKAYIAIDAFTNAKEPLLADQIEQLAEAYAAIGAYDKAAETSQKNKEIYQKYWDAVWLPDEDWCVHAEQHKFIKERVYSVKEKREMPLLACNVCDVWNVLDGVPAGLVAREQRQTEIAGSTKGMSITEARDWHVRNR